MNDVEWRDDALLLYLRKTKADQEGREGQTPYHIYLNVCDPYLNVGLSLACYFVKHPNILNSTHSTYKIFLLNFNTTGIHEFCIKLCLKTQLHLGGLEWK
jgi:hypothetical protein